MNTPLLSLIKNPFFIKVNNVSFWSNGVDSIGGKFKKEKGNSSGKNCSPLFPPEPKNLGGYTPLSNLMNGRVKEKFSEAAVVEKHPQRFSAAACDLKDILKDIGVEYIE